MIQIRHALDAALAERRAGEPPDWTQPLRDDEWDVLLERGDVNRIRRVTISPRFDIYNVTNTNAVVGAVSAYSEFVPTLWRRPFEIFTARLFKIGVSVDW